MRILLKSPPKADEVRIEQFLRKKWAWLEKQLRFFRKYQHKEYKREYVSGESFRYLGRQYQLVVKRGSEDGVALSRGQLMVTTTRPVHMRRYTKGIIDQWYEEQAERMLGQHFTEVVKRFSYKKELSFGIHEMARRWGSCIEKRKVVLNPKLVSVSTDCIDYVITHELCHIQYKNHDKKFFALLDKKYPRWEKAKAKLELQGALA